MLEQPGQGLAGVPYLSLILLEIWGAPTLHNKFTFCFN